MRPSTKLMLRCRRFRAGNSGAISTTTNSAVPRRPVWTLHGSDCGYPNILLGRVTRRNKSSVPLKHAEEELDYVVLKSKVEQQEALSSAQPPRPNSVAEMALPQQEELPVSSLTSPSPSSIMYTGNTEIPITDELHLVRPDEDTPRGVWPVFRMMNETGLFRPPRSGEQSKSSRPYDGDRHDLAALQTHLAFTVPHYASEWQSTALLQPSRHAYPDTNSKNTLMRVHRHMVRVRQMDNILLNAQRQGRIAFYMTCRGEEAIHFGAATALDNGDPLLCQYREQGFLMWRGFSLEQFTNQCFSNDRDLGKGRQMPVHYGSKALQYHTVSSPLGTQLPQAVGVAYRLKLAGKPNVAVAIFGEGCASTTDFHSALNFAATLEAPCIFLCRNNGYAISTPVTDQYAGDGIVARAPGYGMAGIRVDGNDVFAMHAAMRAAKEYALQHNAPVLVEAMTYRQGHHSTSDDSSRYRSVDEVQHWADQQDPVTRLENFLQSLGWVTANEIAVAHDEEKVAVLKAMEQAEKRAKPSLQDLFTDVYYEMPPNLLRQQAQLKEHLQKYPNKYKQH